MVNPTELKFRRRGWFLGRRSWKGNRVHGFDESEEVEIWCGKVSSSEFGWEIVTWPFKLQVLTKLAEATQHHYAALKPAHHESSSQRERKRWGYQLTTCYHPISKEWQAASLYALKRIDFNPDFLKNMLPKSEWKALVDASRSTGYSQLPHGAPESVLLESEEFLKKFHRALLELHLEDGALVCPETGRRFPC